MISNTQIELDIIEVVQFLELYKLTALVWRPEECPLRELKNYVWRGDEELVVVCHKEDKWIPSRLFFDDFCNVDMEQHRISFDFHPEYYTHIIYAVKND